MRAVVGVLVAAVVAVSACTSDDSEDLVAGPAGPTDVGFPALGGDGDGVLLVEGSPGGTATFVDPETGEPEWDVALPFEDPIGWPSVERLPDGRFAVAGVSCPEAVEDDSVGQVCVPGNPTVAILDPADRKWTPLDPLGQETSGEFVQVVGVVAEQVIVQVGLALFSVPLAGGAWRPLPEPHVEHLTEICVGDGTLTVASDQWRSGGPGGPAPIVPVQVTTLDLRTDVWTEPSGPDAAYQPEDSFVLVCLDDAVLAIPSEEPFTDGARHVTFRFDRAGGTWSDVEVPPLEFETWVEPTGDGEVLVLPVNSRGANFVLTYDPASGWDVVTGGVDIDSLDVILAGTDLLYLDRASLDTVSRFEDVLPPP